MSAPDRREELLHLLLDRTAGDEQKRTEELLRARNDPAAADVLAEYDELLAHARGLDRRDEWAPAREKALVKRILAQTTRQDLRWRGDARLVLEFVGQRLRSSPSLRTLAAGVAICLLATSFFAWLAVQPPARPPVKFKIDPELWEGNEAAELSQLEIDPELLTGAEGADEDPGEFGVRTDAERRAWSIENAVRRDRFLLSRWNVPDELPTVTATDAWTVRLLGARAAWLAADAWPTWIDTEATLAAAAGLDRVLLAELLLDHAVQTGDSPEILPRALFRLTRDVEGGDLDGTVAELAARTLARARALGHGDAEAAAPAATAPRPLDDEWRRLLRAALAPALREHPIVQVW